MPLRRPRSCRRRRIPAIASGPPLPPRAPNRRSRAAFAPPSAPAKKRGPSHRALRAWTIRRQHPLEASARSLTPSLPALAGRPRRRAGPPGRSGACSGEASDPALADEPGPAGSRSPSRLTSTHHVARIVTPTRTGWSPAGWLGTLVDTARATPTPSWFTGPHEIRVEEGRIAPSHSGSGVDIADRVVPALRHRVAWGSSWRPQELASASRGSPLPDLRTARPDV